MGVAWDCGAVTTGPVTVPVLLALGVGVMDAQRQKRAALKVLEDAALKKSEGESLISVWLAVSGHTCRLVRLFLMPQTASVIALYPVTLSLSASPT
jgi:hypothetical protein